MARRIHKDPPVIVTEYTPPPEPEAIPVPAPAEPEVAPAPTLVLDATGYARLRDLDITIHQGRFLVTRSGLPVAAGAVASDTEAIALVLAAEF